MWNASRWKIFLEQAVKILCNSWKSTQFCVSWYNQFLFWLLRIKRKVCSAINFCTLTRGEPFSSFWGERDEGTTKKFYISWFACNMRENFICVHCYCLVVSPSLDRNAELVCHQILNFVVFQSKINRVSVYISGQ